MRNKLVGVVALIALLVASGVSSVAKASGPADGIGVRGAWTIEVYNPDGSLDERVQFHNAFTGAIALVDLLSSVYVMAGWEINVRPLLSAGTNLCDTPNGHCNFAATSRRENVTNELVLEGSFSPDFDGAVQRVLALTLDSNSILRSFSSKDFAAAAAIAVAAGQTVQVEVRYSFATAP